MRNYTRSRQEWDDITLRSCHLRLGTILSAYGNAILSSISALHILFINLFLSFQNFKELSYRYFRLCSVIVLCISDIAFTLNHCIERGNLEPKISIWAHVSGAIAGLLLGFLFFSTSATANIVVIRVLRLLSLGTILFLLLYFIKANGSMEIMLEDVQVPEKQIPKSIFQKRHHRSQ